jgi:hypothetical protein
MILRQTTLDLNGPVLSFVTHPQSMEADLNNQAQFSGVATATFPSQTPSNPAENSGTLSYRWYNDVHGALSDGQLLGATLTGTGTTILSITGATSDSLNNTKFYLTVDYTPSAYSQPVGSAVTEGTERSTPNAINDTLSSDSATLTIRPTITVIQQPE